LAEIVPLADALAELVDDGDSVALEGFTHLIPFAAGHELLRQGRRELELIRMTPDVLYDQMVGVGAARKLVFSYAGNPGVGSLHRLRDAIENGWPHAIRIEEHSHAGMANRYMAGASRLACALMRGYSGTELMRHTRIEPIRCPFTGEELVSVPALNPDVTIIHAQEADGAGNVPLWGIPGVKKESVLASDRALVTVEQIVKKIVPRPGGVLIPSWVIDAVAEVPGGSRPSYSLDITERDNGFYREWDGISRDREAFVARLDFLTTTGARTTRVITDLGELEPIGGELILTPVHPGVDIEQVRAAMGRELRVADPVRETPPATDEELSALRELVSRG
jgi:glutaconate CoA-transferase subunit A